MTAAMYELPDDDPELQEAVDSVKAGNVVLLSRHGEPVAALTPLETVVLARKQAAEGAIATTLGQLDAAREIIKAVEQLPSEEVRRRILEPVMALVVREVDEGPSAALVRLMLALQHYNADAVTAAYDWARHLPPAARGEMLRELEEATHSDNPSPPSVRQILLEWQHTAEAYGDPDVYAALTAEHTDHGKVPVPEAM
jgi:antitoxin (DNA-binding transcriptional repressor) of toxin-antitoxin stability system